MKNNINIIENWVNNNFNYNKPIGILNLSEALDNKSFKVLNIFQIIILYHLKQEKNDSSKKK